MSFALSQTEDFRFFFKIFSKLAEILRAYECHPITFARLHPSNNRDRFGIGSFTANFREPVRFVPGVYRDRQFIKQFRYPKQPAKHSRGRVHGDSRIEARERYLRKSGVVGVLLVRACFSTSPVARGRRC